MGFGALINVNLLSEIAVNPQGLIFKSRGCTEVTGFVTGLLNS